MDYLPQERAFCYLPTGLGHRNINEDTQYMVTTAWFHQEKIWQTLVYNLDTQPPKILGGVQCHSVKDASFNHSRASFVIMNNEEIRLPVC